MSWEQVSKDEVPNEVRGRQGIDATAIQVERPRVVRDKLKYRDLRGADLASPTGADAKAFLNALGDPAQARRPVCASTMPGVCGIEEWKCCVAVLSEVLQQGLPVFGDVMLSEVVMMTKPRV